MRLFAGVALDAATRAACSQVQDSLRRAGFDAKFEDPAKLHVTLAFLGNVGDERQAAIAGTMERVAARSVSFELVLDKTGALPNERRPRVVYVGARDQGTSFRTLSGQLREAYAELGFTFHDDPVAHVTIARVKNPQRPLPQVDVVAAALKVESLTLFESIFDKERNSSRYVVSATSRLSPCEPS
ncbi:MAG: RNA 2',3'-cyclic phosphodiesterase [Candidatus Eremiobacteraeota bacterium]|nr:RNA 2',3'-cyclic phosphodiesterase [Candidatus Eremiobacteraeota bacterium]MBV8433498.1 RNA 2',3'-cyclic phosphodiesterase [Candidatus Eremiobacteraeota bacterium]